MQALPVPADRFGGEQKGGVLGAEFAHIAKAFDEMAHHIDLALDRQILHESLVANSSDAIISKTLGGIVTSWNPAAETIFGYTAAEMIGRPLAMLFPADRLAEEAEILERIRRGERIRNYQTIRRRKNGELFPVSVTVSPILDMNGTIVGASKIARDITEAANAAQALKRAEERYELVIAGMCVGVWDWDLLTGEMFASARLREMLGSRPRHIVADTERFTDRMHPEDRRQVREQLLAHLERRERFDVVYRIRLEGENYLWVHTVGQAQWDETGRPIRMAGSLEDITQRNKLEKDLVEMVDRLQKSNKDLDDFAYAASHDLKAPLRVIDNTSQWLMEDLEPHLTPETRENMNLLRSRVRRMEKLLGDLLEYSRIGRNQDEDCVEIVRGGELLENILALLSPAPGFAVLAEPGFAEVWVTRMPLQQVLMNLIGNAIKHHDKQAGAIRLGVEDLGASYAFTVADDGPGIPPQYHEKVFEMFRTLKPRDQVEGSGMGLAMVRKHVEMFGGSIHLKSRPGQGASFRFTWPKAQPAGATGA